MFLSWTRTEYPNELIDVLTFQTKLHTIETFKKTVLSQFNGMDDQTDAFDRQTTDDEVVLTDANLEPVAVYVLNAIDELRAVANPIRVRILDCLGSKPMTVRDLGKLLQTGSTNLYYHVGELEKSGLVRLVRTEIQSGIQLKYYRAIAHYFYLSPTLLHGGKDESHASAEFVASLIEGSARELRLAFAGGHVDRHSDAFVVRRRQNRMTIETAAEFRRRIEAIDVEFQETDEPEGELSVEFSVALFPRTR